MTETSVVTVFLRHRGEVLLLRRSEEVGSYPGQWGAVAGHLDHDDPLDTALTEIEEEAGLAEHDVHLVREGPSFSVEDEERGASWTIHPFLFDADTRDITLNWETAEAEWASPTVLLRRDTVPELWTSYRRAAPSIVALTNDTTHGSAHLSLRALEILRDRAALLATADAPDVENAHARLADTAHQLLHARPSMAALANRLHRVLHACAPDLVPADVEERAHAAIADAIEADAAAARCTADCIADQRVLTLSRSGTVLDALLDADPAPSVVIADSRPGGEGIDVAETLADAGLDVSLVPDAAVATTLTDSAFDAVLVGADTILPSGAVVNKVGTRGAALAARHEDVPVYATAAADKIAVDPTEPDEEADPKTAYDGPAPVGVWAPRFDRTPPELITEFLTDRSTLAPDTINAVADELRALREWSTP